MGSWASGNYSRERRPTTEEYPFIHVRDVIDMPLLAAIWLPLLTADIPYIRVRGTEQAVELGMAVKGEVSEIGFAEIVYSPRNFGGEQPYFQCQCGKLSTKLYIGGDVIACRQCQGLLYNSQFNAKYEQPAVKAAKLRAKLGGGPALLQPLPPRPKYMRRETYETLCYQITALEIEAAQELKQYRDTRWLPKLLKLDELAATI